MSIGAIGQIKKLNHLTINIDEKSEKDHDTNSNLDSAIMDTDRAIDGK
jgi:hypothetical protein